jgi:hypothetical protein
MNIFCRLKLWLQIEQPPYLGTRCGTPLIGANAEQLRATFVGWRAYEMRYVEWVEAHPRPKAEWVRVARRIRADWKNKGWEKGPK